MNPSKIIYLASVPSGPISLNNFETKSLDISHSLSLGEVLVKNVYISVDPYLVGKLRGVSTYTSPFEVGKPIESMAIAEVIKSNSPNLLVGDKVRGTFPWAEFAVVSDKGARKIQPEIDPEILMGVCGGTGLTAYFGLLDIGNPKRGEVVVISGAAGATGSIVGQIAKLKGCTVIGITGSDQKVNFLVEELGFDKAINYKSTNFQSSLKEACPEGIDIYFDNVGGEILDISVTLMNNYGRVVCCGAISTYTSKEIPKGARLESYLIQRRLKFQGFIVTDFFSRWEEATKELLQWHSEGKIKNKITLMKGFDSIPHALIELLKGSNTGKMLVKI
jgi:NADPH-dependent curcumin reductase CurA